MAVVDERFKIEFWNYGLDLIVKNLDKEFEPTIRNLPNNTQFVWLKQIADDLAKEFAIKLIGIYNKKDLIIVCNILLSKRDGIFKILPNIHPFMDTDNALCHIHNELQKDIRLFDLLYNKLNIDTTSSNVRLELD